MAWATGGTGVPPLNRVPATSNGTPFDQQERKRLFQSRPSPPLITPPPDQLLLTLQPRHLHPPPNLPNKLDKLNHRMPALPRPHSREVTPPPPHHSASRHPNLHVHRRPVLDPRTNPTLKLRPRQLSHPRTVLTRHRTLSHRDPSARQPYPPLHQPLLIRPQPHPHQPPIALRQLKPSNRYHDLRQCPPPHVDRVPLRFRPSDLPLRSRAPPPQLVLIAPPPTQHPRVHASVKHHSQHQHRRNHDAPRHPDPREPPDRRPHTAPDGRRRQHHPRKAPPRVKRPDPPPLRTRPPTRPPQFPIRPALQ